MDTLQIILLSLSVISYLPALIGGYKNRQSLLWKYLLAGLVFDIIMITVRRALHYNPFPVANLFVLIEFIILSAYYAQKFAIQKKWATTSIGVIGMIYIIYVLINGVFERNGIASTIFSFTYIIYSLLGFYYILQKQDEYSSVKSSFLLANIAVLFCFSGRFLLFLFEDYLKEHYADLLKNLWLYYKILSIVVNIIFASALYKKDE